MTAATERTEMTSIDVKRLRDDFPILSQTVHGKPLVYLDNAATAQKPRSVIEAVSRYYAEENSNVHRGVHRLSELATAAYEGAREKVRAFLGAASTREVVFVRGCTEGINLVAGSFGRQHVGPGAEARLTEMEHHSNIVPWQMLCEQQGARLVVVPIDDHGDVPLEEFVRRLSPRTKLAAISHVSNALGTVLPVKAMVERAHDAGVPVLVDGAQAVPHMAVDVMDLGCDFYTFSGHKVFAPTGIGALWAREALLETMPPWQGGGDMIASVSFEKTIYNDLPYKFEAGTPNIAGAVGLGAALDYVAAVGPDRIAAHEARLLEAGTRLLLGIPGLRLVGTAPRKASVLSFVLEGVHPHDVGTLVDQDGIAIRTGHHCAQPVMERFGIPATARASLALYNTESELEALATSLRRVQEMFA